VPWRVRRIVHYSCADARVAPQLRRNPLGGCKGSESNALAESRGLLPYFTQRSLYSSSGDSGNARDARSFQCSKLSRRVESGRRHAGRRGRLATFAASPWTASVSSRSGRTWVAGWVVLDAIVGPDGRAEAQSARLVALSDSIFLQPTEQALMASEFTPGRKKGVPVRVLIRQPIFFRIPH